jgi:hypothetical protein
VESLPFHQEAQRHHDIRLVVDHQHPLGHGPIAPVRRLAVLWAPFNATSAKLSGRFRLAAGIRAAQRAEERARLLRRNDA